jgi:dihydrofolate reductase
MHVSAENTPQSQQLTLSLVAAIAANGVIGIDNRIPWRLPVDMKRFRQLTLGKPIIMGRKTYESIGRPLPTRTNIILTRNQEYEAEGCIVVNSVAEGIEAAGDAAELMVIGAFETLLPYVSRMYLTLIDAVVEGDTFFPDYDSAEWHVTASESFLPDQKNRYAFCFVTLERLTETDPIQ